MSDEAVANETLALLEEWAEREPKQCRDKGDYRFMMRLGNCWHTIDTHPEFLRGAHKAIISAAVQERFAEAGVSTTCYVWYDRTRSRRITIYFEDGIDIHEIDDIHDHLAWLRTLVSYLKQQEENNA